MLRALWIKEWTQLRSLRWVGFGLGILFPPFLVTVAEAARRGWIPLASMSGYSVRDLFLNALPGLATALWGLLALMMASQAFAADRSAGTESFVLERPVSRSKIWLARLLAGGASTLVLVLAHLAVYLALIQIVAGPSGGEWSVAGETVLRAALELNVPVGKAIMAYSVGDAWTNLFQPFWAIPLLGITGIQARDMFGYCITMLFALLPFLAIALTVIPY